MPALHGITKQGMRKLALMPRAADGRFSRPAGFSTIECTSEQATHLNKVAVETFMEMANKGASFADCLGSVLLTGMHFAAEVAKPNAQGEPTRSRPTDTSP